MIKLIAIGKNKDKALQSLEKEYMKRLSAFCKFSEIEVKDEANEHVSREAEVLLVKDTFNKLGYKAKINTHITSCIN